MPYLGCVNFRPMKALGTSQLVTRAKAISPSIRASRQKHVVQWQRNISNPNFNMAAPILKLYFVSYCKFQSWGKSNLKIQSKFWALGQAMHTPSININNSDNFNFTIETCVFLETWQRIWKWRFVYNFNQIWKIKVLLPIIFNK